MAPPRRILPGVLTLALFFLNSCTSGLALPTPDVARATSTPYSRPIPTILLSTPELGVESGDLNGLQLQVWHAFYGSAAEAFEHQVALFNTLNGLGITIYTTRFPDYPSLLEMGEGAKEDRPDLVIALPEQIRALTNDEALVNLTPYLQDGRWGLSSAEIHDIPSAFWEQDALGEERWAVPLARSGRFLFYNLTWARQLGFERPPTTAEEFRQQACAANAALRADADIRNDGYGGWLIDTHWQTIYAWLLAFGGGVVEGNRYQFETKANRAALVFLKELYDAHCAWLPQEAIADKALARRLALFVSGDLSEVPRFQKTMEETESTDEWTLLPYPGDGQTAVITYGASAAILRSTPPRQLAGWIFARWLLLPERQALWAIESGFLPLRYASLASLGDYQDSHPAWEAAVTLLPVARPLPSLASWHKVKYVLSDGTYHLFRINLPLEEVSSLLAEMQITAQALQEEK